MEKQAIIKLDKTASNFLKGLAILLVIIGHMGYIELGSKLISDFKWIWCIPILYKK